MSRNPIDDLLLKISDKASNSKNFNRKLNIEMRNIVSNVTNIANKSASVKGYCMSFIVPRSEFLKLIPPLLGLSEAEIKVGMETAWEQPVNARVKGSSYILTLALVYNYAAMINDKALASYAIQLLLFRNWTAIHKKTWKLECNPEIMSYVIAHIPSKQYTVSKYSNPLQLIEKHLTPGIIKKYFEATKRDSLISKRVNDQVYSRVFALFYKNNTVDLKTNTKSHKAGLAAWYYDAHKNNKRIKIATSSDAESGIEDFTSVHSTVEITKDVTRLIISTFDPEYDKEFDAVIKATTIGVKQTIVDTLLKAFYKPKYKNLIEDMVSLILTRMNQHLNKICTSEFYPLVRSSIVVSKNNMLVSKIKTDLADKIISDIFKENFTSKLPYEKWSLPRKASYRAVLIYAVAYNIRQVVCNTRG